MVDAGAVWKGRFNMLCLSEHTTIKCLHSRVRLSADSVRRPFAIMAQGYIPANRAFWSADSKHGDKRFIQTSMSYPNLQAEESGTDDQAEPMCN